MNKKQVLTTLALSTLALAQAGFVSADELAPIDSSAPTTEVVTPTAPSASTETEAPAVQPTEPSVTPVDPTAPSDKDNAGSLDGVPADKPAPSDKAQDKDNAGSLDGVPTPSDKPQDKDNAGSLDGVPADKPAPSDKAQDKDNAGSLDGVPDEQPKTTDQANQQGKSQIGTTSTSTGQVVHDVTKEPVETNTGASIVSTQNGNVVLSDGSVVAPEEVGGTVNEDKTISVTDSEGKLKTLPNTGTAESILGAIGAMLLTAVGYFYKKKMF
ncbi:LPXTG cell wall anchor domain-containing protein [Streptococcus oralis]|uniref:LPXTG cell wall anchor domain-containing protein n=1 Tax=Streptococcus oralis TaxID=1303 RepID=UPI0020C93629|nr:LPXTG cell wall anchor domain-containing protein [Streptococcus oralis]MCP9037835.1 LPXTG cell wall anchor domain-containing protein [Streptococcus oralis]MCP9052425.1 LPXTG cell wall anchor domain-containing protein [Streptococcus oralis]MCP9059278.1 LPXTG cell wall anchor domain-containing protein [Streptococcus oralis]MCP9065797.1 LPXTG cell wall anchor domain-containing protein [Streptococcus oralis]MCP9070116.1 LPXTG cell wall anchor domain-containing protein [Streptococcus oralis]